MKQQPVRATKMLEEIKAWPNKGAEGEAERFNSLKKQDSPSERIRCPTGGGR
jgi:hypothetical protein